MDEFNIKNYYKLLDENNFLNKQLMQYRFKILELNSKIENIEKDIKDNKQITSIIKKNEYAEESS